MDFPSLPPVMHTATKAIICKTSFLSTNNEDTSTNTESACVGDANPRKRQISLLNRHYFYRSKLMHNFLRRAIIVLDQSSNDSQKRNKGSLQILILGNV